MPDRGQNARLRRLAALLRQLRHDAGLTADEAAGRADVSAPTLTRLERGQSLRPKRQMIVKLLDAYEIDDTPQREALLDLARRASVRGWWRQYDDVFPDPYPDFEAEASSIRTYEPLVVPGLLQTPDYAAEVARAARVRNRSEIDRHIATRMERQRILTRRTPPPPQYWALIDECALIRQAGPADLMRAQYERLVEAADLPNVNLQIIPLSAGLHAGMAGQFVILDFPEPVDPSTVYVETAIDGLFREKPEELARYTLIYDYLRGDAMSVDDSIAWLADRINRLG